MRARRKFAILITKFKSEFYNRYDGGVIVNRSLELGERVVYVSMNYRLSGKPLYFQVTTYTDEVYADRFWLSSKQGSQIRRCGKLGVTRSWEHFALGCALTQPSQNARLSFGYKSTFMPSVRFLSSNIL